MLPSLTPDKLDAIEFGSFVGQTAGVCLAGEAILKACDDAGLSVKQIDGFTYYAGATAGYVDKFETGSFMETLGMPQVSFTAALTSGGGGSAGAIGLAVAGLTNEDCKYAVTVMACQQTERACPNCSSRDKAWPTLSGTGTVFSYAICTRNPLTGEDFVYVPVVVDLDGAPGTRLIGNLTGCDAEDVRIGMPVSVEWTEIRDDWVLPNFRTG